MKGGKMEEKMENGIEGEEQDGKSRLRAAVSPCLRLSD